MQRAGAGRSLSEQGLRQAGRVHPPVPSGPLRKVVVLMNLELDCFGFVVALDPKTVEALLVTVLVLACRQTRAKRNASSEVQD